MRVERYGTAGADGRPLELWVQPRRDTSERRPGIVFVHGGGWAAFTPAIHARDVRQMASLGWVAATISYRLTGEAPWPAAIEDVKCAIRWMRASADELGLDPDRIVVAGGSAGGHLAAMAALTPGLLEGDGGHGDHSSAVQAAVLWYPAVDLRALARTEGLVGAIDALLPGGTEADQLAASPIAHVAGGAPPILTLTGDIDGLTPLDAIDAFHIQLDDAGVVNELVVFEGRGHGFDFHPGDWLVCHERLTDFLAGAIPPAPVCSVP